jgi:hypothetical protein
MVSRRAFLAGSGAVTAGGFGLLPGLTVSANAADLTTGSGSRLLPVFNRPQHLDYGDVSKLSGGDQTLLTTLQGVVNRTQPELYFNYDTGTMSTPDTKWLADMHLPTKQYANPLDLVAKYRSRIRGAIVHDPDVPDSLNVATTLAGLENAVVADADQAKAHGLRIVKDLRGMFDADRVKTYRWQLDNLFPRVTHQLLAGLPPTMVVQVENVQWQEIARETRQIRDSSNRGSYDLDVSAKLGQQAVFVRFQDSFTDDGWGPSVSEITVKANGTQIAHFLPGTPEEAPYLFDGVNSSIGGEANRFSDGGGYFIYRFEPPAGTTSLVVTVTMWNQYLITATDTAPTRIEPFPYFRDYVVATKALVSWLPPGGETGELLIEHYAKYPTLAPYMGWFANDVSGEWDGVDLASQGGSPVIAADFYMNGTVHAGFTAPISDKVRPVRRITKPKNKVYLTLTFGEGDNIQYCQRRMRDLWDDPKRGEALANWTVSPLLAEAGPGLFSLLPADRDGQRPSGLRSFRWGLHLSRLMARRPVDVVPADVRRLHAPHRDGSGLRVQQPPEQPVGAVPGGDRQGVRRLHAGEGDHPVMGRRPAAGPSRRTADHRDLGRTRQGRRVQGRSRCEDRELGRGEPALHRGRDRRLVVDTVRHGRTRADAR